MFGLQLGVLQLRTINLPHTYSYRAHSTTHVDEHEIMPMPGRQHLRGEGQLEHL